MKKALIIGGGIGGAVAAIELSKRQGWSCTIVEASMRLGAGLRTHWVSGLPCTFGPRHFLTHDESCFSYINSIIPMRLCAEHEFITYVEDDCAFYSYPIHEDDVPRMPEADAINRELASLDEAFKGRSFRLTTGESERDLPASDYRDFWLKSVGPTLYKKFIQSYTQKMWRVEDESIIDDFSWSPKGVAVKRGPRAGWDSAISAYPSDQSGYDRIFDIAASVCEVRLGSRVEFLDPRICESKIGSVQERWDVVINTTPIDSLMDYCYGRLKYIGRDIDFITLPIEFALPPNVYFCYYAGREKFTRVTEYKKFSRVAAPHTVISLERPSENGRLYPMPIREERERFQRYISEAGDNFHSIGRLGLFNYRYDIDDVVSQARSVVASL